MNQINLPKVIDAKLAEIFGIIVGDGYIRNKSPWWISVEGGKEEKDYIDERVAPLFSKTFKIKVIPRFFDRHGKKDDDYGILIHSKKLVEFFTSYNLTTYHDFIEVPKIILENKKFWSHFLRGYFDTDGYINFFTHNGIYNSYPRIGANTVSEKLANQIVWMLRNLGFKLSFWSYKPKKGNRKRIYRFEMKGKPNLEKWFSEIGFKNPIKISRYLIWKKYGFCPSYTTFQERKDILNKDLNIGLLIDKHKPW